MYSSCVALNYVATYRLWSFSIGYDWAIWKFAVSWWKRRRRSPSHRRDCEAALVAVQQGCSSCWHGWCTCAARELWFLTVRSAWPILSHRSIH